jgi:glycosyltransferase involved in cell wall biosynthesis
MTAPRLTIAIPTWNRAGFLRDNLRQLERELRRVREGEVELLVSDNGSDDDTPAVLADAAQRIPQLRSVRKPGNVGWGLNFLSCLQLARGDYVMLLADDDFIVDGGLARILETLERNPDYGSLTLGAYGFDRDFVAEHPGTVPPPSRDYASLDDYLVDTALANTLLSATVMRRASLALEDAVPDDERNLAHFKYVLRAALGAPVNRVIGDFVLASKRDNSSSYPYARVFVTELWAIYDKVLAGSRHDALRARIKHRLLVHYYPRYFTSFADYVPESDADVLRRCDEAFGQVPVYRWLFRPVLRLPPAPRYALFGAWTLVSRILLGEFHAVRRYLASRLSARWRQATYKRVSTR